MKTVCDAFSKLKKYVEWNLAPVYHIFNAVLDAKIKSPPPPPPQKKKTTKKQKTKKKKKTQNEHRLIIVNVLKAMSEWERRTLTPY